MYETPIQKRVSEELERRLARRSANSVTSPAPQFATSYRRVMRTADGARCDCKCKHTTW